MALPSLVTFSDNVATTSFAKPAGSTSGRAHVLLVVTYDADDTGDIAATCGVGKTYALQASKLCYFGGGSDPTTVSALTRVLDGTEGATIAIAGTGYTDSCTMLVQDGDPAGLLDGLAIADGTVGGSASTTPVIPQITTTGVDRLLISMKGGYGGGTSADPAGWTPVIQDQDTVNDYYVRNALTAGAYGPTNMTQGASSWGTIVLAIKGVGGAAGHPHGSFRRRRSGLLVPRIAQGRAA